MRLRIFLIGFILFFSIKATYAQNHSINDFTLKNVIDNKEISLSDFKGSKGVVVIFTSNYCPYAKLYEKRIQNLAANYSRKNIEFLLINPNNPKSNQQESVEAMAQKARKEGYNFPYLKDQNHKVASLMGATKTPEVFLLTKNQKGFVISYQGAIDDNPQVENDVKTYYLKDALDQVVAGNKLSYKNQKATGCMIR
ncbi:thioredoxin family protein [Xanthovirga aplysinae]|uniref:thioredoxin family protein n=1 Tax=Xanthovirga aplysinae TaxID=2529853 RepID=UPI0012BD647E|nr:thioredoxin family protein [Xanthovirga aplysinae]MTI33363.1 thioredoxin family protein [Xanthovirga aplysinae]